MGGLVIRPASQDDVGAIAVIYNDVLATSSAIWSEQPTSVAERRKWLAAATRQSYPIFVAEDASGVIGFIAVGPFRPWPGYGSTVEHSIHVRRDARSCGVGRRLLTVMEQALASRGTHVMVAGIDSGNDGSLRFHARAGFAVVATMPEVGRVRGSWRDLVLVQKILADDPCT